MQEDSVENDEIVLVRTVLQGHPEVFQTIVVRYEPQLLRYLTHMLGNRENARDLVQETFLAAYQGLPHWKAPQTAEMSKRTKSSQILAPWLYRIATNLALNWLKKQTRDVYFSQPPNKQKNLSMLTDIPADEIELEKQYMLRETLREALCTLSEEDAACLILRFVADETYAEIAERLHMTSEAVRKRVSRGIISLRTIYTQRMEVSQ
jgi:RNA polymerase sigma-70 factor (ECF subfamily)